MAAARTGFDREAASNSVSVVAFASPTLAYPTAELTGSASPSNTAQLAPGTEASAIHDWTGIVVRLWLLASAGTEAPQAATAVPIRSVRRVGFIRAFARTS